MIFELVTLSKIFLLHQFKQINLVLQFLNKEAVTEINVAGKLCFFYSATKLDIMDINVNFI